MTRENAPDQIDAQLQAVRERHRRRTTSADDGSEENRPTGGESSPWRGIAIGLVGVAILSVVTPYCDTYLQASGLAATYLPTGVFLLFLLLLGGNTLLRRGRFALSQQELMLAYVIMLTSAVIPSDGLVLRFLPVLAELYYYATPVNEWAILHWPHVQSWVVPHGETAIDWFFTGKPADAAIPWGAWVRPLGAWALLASALYMIMISLSVVLRRRWMDAERLQFPLAQIPLMIMGDDPAPSWASGFFKQPLVWVGFAVPTFFHMVNGLHVHYPAIPSITLTGLELGTLFSGSDLLSGLPFSYWRDVKVNFYWSVIGIAFLLRSEVSLGVWAFEWLYNIEEIIFGVSGLGHGQHEWSPLHTFGYTLTARYQRVGAMLVATGVFMWASRNELREMVRGAFARREAGARSESEIPRWTFWVFLGGVVIYFLWTSAAGMKVYVAAIMLLFFLVIVLIAARIIATTGFPWVYDYFRSMYVLTKLVGTARIDPNTFTNVGLVDWGALNNRVNIMPQVLDSMKIARRTGIRQGHFFLGVTLGIILAIGVSFTTVLWISYTYGGVNLSESVYHGGGNWLFNRIAGFQKYHVFTDWTVIGCITGGGAVMALLLYLHRTYLWWPLYPLGFIIGGTVASEQIWFAIFVGWLLKTLVLRFGGAAAYHRFRGAALGLIIGEFVQVGFWLVIDAATNTTLHRVFPVWTPF